MWKFVKKNKFLIFSIVGLIILTIVDVSLTVKALKNSGNYIITMLLIVPPIFILIGLFDVWVPRETVIKLMGEKSGVKGMALAFFLGAFSAGPTLAAFPVALIMMKKGAKYSNVLFFLMVWSSLKIPIVLYQVTTIGLQFSLIINISMIVVFIIGAYFSEKIMSKDELDALYKKAEQQK